MMANKLSALAVVPARGGSKRVPGKNTRLLKGRPLIAYTIDAARDCGLFARIVVTTDSPSIAEIARTYGAEVPFLREPALADDVTPVSAATLDALERLDPTRSQYAHVCQLMPNCPLRTAADVTAGYRQFVETGANAQLSVVRFGWQNPWWAMRRAADLTLSPLFAEQMAERSQDLPELFSPTGAVWWIKADVLREQGTFHIPGRTGWEISWAHGIDIDTEEDWALAEALASLDSGSSPAQDPSPDSHSQRDDTP